MVAKFAKFKQQVGWSEDRVRQKGTRVKSIMDEDKEERDGGRKGETHGEREGGGEKRGMRKGEGCGEQ
jgi:hypothetical protein